MAEQKSPRWRNWSREQSCRPVEILRPRTREGLIAAVIAARGEGRRVRVAGAGHSFSEAALTEGTMLRLEGLDRILEIDRTSGLVKVEGGIILRDLSRRLAAHGLALENLGDIDLQTLAGSISTGTHGTGARFGNISSQVEAIELVGPDGSLRELTRSSDPDGLLAARVGLGALGVIYSVTLRTVLSFRLERIDRPRPLAETLDRLDELADGTDHFEFYVFPYSKTALCRESARTDRPPEPPSAAAVYMQEVVLQNWVASGLASVARRLPAAIPALSRLAVAGAGSGRKLDESHKVFASERRLRFTEMEHSVPREDARAAIEGVLEIASRPELAVAFPIEVRFVAADDAMLSPSHERHSAYIAVHYDHRGDWRPYFRAVAELMVRFGGRPHWGKRHFLDEAALESVYPRLTEFRAIRSRLDPEGAFASDYTDRVIGPVI